MTGRTIKIVLAYDGAGFVGWQRQAEGTSVQGLVEDALAAIEGRPVAAVGAGRTDAGVHALGQVVSARLTSALDPSSIRRALNARMPPAVRALAVEEAAPDFNARFDAVSKIYRYLIVDAETCSPLDDGRVWHVRQRLDVGAMERAAVLLEGRHDFAAFQSGGATAAPTVRRVSRSALVVHPASEDGAYRHEPGARTIVYEIAGSGFLRHMVRNVVGTLVEIGHGRRPPAAMEAILESRDRSRAGRTAPASGLYLLHVEFGDSDETGKGEADEDA